MKSIFLTTTFLMIAALSLGQNFNLENLEERGENEKIVNEKVKNKKTFVFLFQRNGKIEKKGTLIGELFYDDFGKLTKIISYAQGKIIMSVAEISYDSYGRKKKQVAKDPSGDVSQTTVFKYEENGVIKKEYIDRWNQLISITEQNEKLYGDYEFSYNSKHEIISKTYSKFDSLPNTYTWRILTPENSLRYENKYWFNTKKQIYQCIKIDIIQNKKTKIIFNYDDNGNCIEELYYDEVGELTKKTSNKYNEKNLLAERFWSNSNGEPLQVVKFEYKF